MSGMKTSFRKEGCEGNFAGTNSDEARIEKAKDVIAKNPGRVPVVIEVSHKSKLPPLKNYRQMVPKEYKLSQIVSGAIRQELTLPQDCSVFMYCNGTSGTNPTLLNSGRQGLIRDMQVGEIYNKYKSKDGFLYLQYSEISTLGN